MKASVAIIAAKEQEEKARALALKLSLPFSDEADYLLQFTEEKLELLKSGSKTKPLLVDFSKFVVRKGKEPIVKAIGLKGSYYPKVLDTTAGLGQDAFVMASYGANVTLCERSSIVAALLQDGLNRAKADAATALTIERMTLMQKDAKSYLEGTTEVFDVIYLDPMYPESGKSAAKRKSMTFFRDLVGDDLDAAELLNLALLKANKRVVVKRPLKAPCLTDKNPSSQLKGRTTRFDIYLP